MAYIVAGDLCVNYRFDGPADAPVVMFANSLGTDLRLWDAQIDAFADEFRMLRYDVRGHGLTECGDEPNISMATLARDALALLDALGIDRVAFVGLSIGGMIGQSVAAQAPQRVQVLALCATAARIGTAALWSDRIEGARTGGMASLVPGTLQRWFTPATRAQHPDMLRFFATMVARTTVEGYTAACGALRDADLTHANAAITAPTLVISGAHDAVATPEMGVSLSDSISGAAMSVLPDAAHLLCAEQPAAFNAALAPFLRRHLSPSGARR